MPRSKNPSPTIDARHSSTRASGTRTLTHTSRDNMADDKEALRALKIKTGVMTRIKKELAMYEQEVKTVKTY